MKPKNIRSLDSPAVNLFFDNTTPDVGYFKSESSKLLWAAAKSSCSENDWGSAYVVEQMDLYGTELSLQGLIAFSSFNQNLLNCADRSVHSDVLGMCRHISKSEALHHLEAVACQSQGDITGGCRPFETLEGDFFGSKFQNLSILLTLQI